MRIFGALLDAGMENFVITEQLDCGNISEDDDVGCSICEYYTGECSIDGKRHEWFDYCKNHKLKSTIAKNATVGFIRCKDCTFFHSGYCELRNDKADGETLVCPSFLIRPKRIELIEG